MNIWGIALSLGLLRAGSPTCPVYDAGCNQLVFLFTVSRIVGAFQPFSARRVKKEMKVKICVVMWLIIKTPNLNLTQEPHRYRGVRRSH